VANKKPVVRPPEVTEITTHNRLIFSVLRLNLASVPHIIVSINSPDVGIPCTVEHD